MCVLPLQTFPMEQLEHIHVVSLIPIVLMEDVPDLRVIQDVMVDIHVQLLAVLNMVVPHMPLEETVSPQEWVLVVFFPQ
jgi:hypothetical protein